jgi:rhodanese-related sulfurtransferase
MHVALRDLFGRSEIAQLAPEMAKQKQTQGAILLDVREPSEWRKGHIPGAVHIPLGALTSRLRELDPAREVVTVCRSGNRSMAAARILNSAGFTQVSNLAGGMIVWSRSGLPVRS